MVCGLSGGLAMAKIATLSAYFSFTLFSTVLNSVKLKYADKVAILAIANPPDNPQTMTPYANAHKLAYPLLLDQGQVAASYVRAPSLDLPTVYLIDGNGMIRNSWVNSALTKDIFEGNGT